SESISGTVRGRVSDPSDQAVAGSNVTAVNSATGYTRTVTSGEDGYYVIASLPIGTYTVTVTKSGFTTLRFTEVVLRAGQEAVVDGALKLGELTTAIEVSGGALVVDPDRTNIGRTISEVQTVSSSFAPEFGGTTGNIYNVITGSGTNDLHGMFQWIRGPVDTTARPILLPASQPKPNLLLNSFGMNAGGPIKKDKLFFYGAYEHLYRALPVPITVDSTTQAQLESVGVPASQFGTAPSVQHAQFLDARGDWDIDPKNRLFVRVNYFRNEYPFNTAVGGLHLIG